MNSRPQGMSVKLRQLQEQCYPFLSVCTVFSCVHTMVRLPVLVFFKVRTNGDACGCTWGGDCTNTIIVYPESWHCEKDPLPHSGMKPPPVSYLAFGSNTTIGATGSLTTDRPFRWVYKPAMGSCEQQISPSGESINQPQEVSQQIRPWGEAINQPQEVSQQISPSDESINQPQVVLQQISPSDESINQGPPCVCTCEKIRYTG